jgi:glycosyltransferase involved in cell wall biosynthesis
MQNAIQLPEVSVIINCLNGERYLQEAIDSVYAQSFRSWEIILWDNASTDRTGEIANSYDGNLRYFRGNETVPLGQARNLAIEKARGRYIAFLDCDDLWLPEKLERQIPLFGDPEVGLVFSDVLQFNNHGYSAPRFGQKHPPQGMVFDYILFNNFLCMSSVVMRSDLFKKHNHWFDSRFTCIEDTDLIIRIARQWQVAYAPFVLTKYRMHDGSFTYSKPMMFRSEEDLMVEKFKSIFPEFSRVHELRYMSQIRRDRAVNIWKQGDNSAARKTMKPLIFKNRRFLLYYLLMFLPYPVIHRLRLLFSKQAIQNY